MKTSFNFSLRIRFRTFDFIPHTHVFALQWMDLSAELRALGPRRCAAAVKMNKTQTNWYNNARGARTQHTRARTHGVYRHREINGNQVCSYLLLGMSLSRSAQADFLRVDMKRTCSRQSKVIQLRQLPFCWNSERECGTKWVISHSHVCRVNCPISFWLTTLWTTKLVSWCRGHTIGRDQIKCWPIYL